MRAGEAQWRRIGALVLLAAAASAHADYKDDYAHGLKAYRDGQYAEARKLLQQALDDHAEPAQKIRLYGQVYDSYLPQHYLGMSAFKLGDCNAAVAQWSSNANKQIIAQFPEMSGEEQRGSASCGPKVVAKVDDKPPVTPPVEPKTTKPTVAENKPPENVSKPPPIKPPPEEKPPVAKSGPPEPLVQAFDNFLAGRYSDVARINPDSYADSRARFHAYLVRAAAKYTLARLSADEALLKAARADAAAAHALDVRVQPDAALFSPGFRAFFQESR